jgi:NADH-quinone oxidoreductase subunit C/D
VDYDQTIIGQIQMKFEGCTTEPLSFQDGLPSLKVTAHDAPKILQFLKRDIDQPFQTLYDLTAIDQRARQKGRTEGEDFAMVYHLLSYERNNDVRLFVPLKEDALTVDSITDLWPAANWYEREVWDMFGIHFKGHPCLRRILSPPDWEGHPLRKDHPARATEMDPYMQSDEEYHQHEDALIFRPEEWGLPATDEAGEYMYLNLGPNHPGTHGVLRLILRLYGEEIVDLVPDIGFHHRGAEKMGERQTFHSFIPYTDRIDYLGGVNNNLAYLLAVEKLAAITVPRRAQQIRVMLCELYRMASHLVWLGTYGHDVGAMTPVFWTFKEREKIFDIVASITGDRMHPNWFRIGGLAQDLPEGWETMMASFCDNFEKSIGDFEALMSHNSLFKARTKDIGAYSLEDAIAWGVTGPNLRSCGMDWDFRKKRPYSGYEEYDFDVPLATQGDSYDRCVVRIQEMVQSVRIIRQVMEKIEPGDTIADHPLAIPGKKARTMEDIESLIHHFLGVSWGFGMPEGGAHASIEAPKGNNGYFVLSDGGTFPYRMRIRAPSFAHMQTLPLLSVGHQVADLLAIIGSLDYVLADIDR